MAAANEKAQVQVAAAALSLFKGACDSGTHLITMHTLSDEQSDALLKPCVVRGEHSVSASIAADPLSQDALQKLKAECESATRCACRLILCELLVLMRCRFLRLQNQPSDSLVLQDAAAEFAMRVSMVGSDIRQSVSSKWQTVRRCVCVCVCARACVWTARLFVTPRRLISTLTGKKSGP